MIQWPTDAEQPAGYPKDLEGEFGLSDRRRVWIRPIIPSDADDLAEAIAQADRDTLFHRFFTAAPHLSEEQIHYLADVDYEQRLALLALDNERRGIAVARYEGLPDAQTAEVAVAVDPGWRGIGLATELLRRLEGPARRNGFSRFDAIYLPENRSVARVFESLEYSDQRIEDGLAFVWKALV